MAKTMCKYVGDGPCPRDNKGYIKCPRGANLGCQIIPKKRVRRMKAWAVVFKIHGYRFEQPFETREEARVFKEYVPNGFVRDYRKGPKP